jgi:hypothetical protein
MSSAPLDYEVVARGRAGGERIHRYVTDEPLEPGGIIRLEGRFWLVETVEPDEDSPRVRVVPARYRLRLHHPDDREELGAFRRYGVGAPHVGHGFTTIDGEEPVTWSVVEERLAHDELGEPYLDLVAERDYSEREELPDHELEHSVARGEDELPEAAAETLAQAQAAGLAAELVALEPGVVPDWDEAARSIDVLIFEEVEDDLFELCGVDVDEQPQDTWLDTVKDRLRNDLASFRDDIEGDHDEIEEWDFLDGRIFAVVGSADDESNPDIGFGWLCRLLDAGVLRAGGFHRVRKPELEASSE